MENIGGVTDQEKVWLKCTRCHHMSLISMVADSKNDSAVDTAKATSYEPQKSFTVGESIFHTEWNDFGKVLGKTKTSNGNNAIVVVFEKQGQRTLIENFTPTETETEI
jgi:hypothetical protein